MKEMFSGLYGLVWGILKIPLVIILICVVLFAVLCLYHYIKLRAHGVQRKKRTVQGTYKKRSIFRRLIVDLPKRVTEDYMEADPDEFPYRGIVIFTGEQGNGKTIGMVEFVTRMRQEYPLAKTLTNFCYENEDDVLRRWEQLLTFSNGKQGVIVSMDELQNWFSCKDSKDFPPEMLSVVTQNRKNKRIILGTAQEFYMLAKDIRTQTTEIRSCFTLFGCLTIVRRVKPIFNEHGDITELKKKGTYFFVHSKELRESYDTYKVIERLAKSGFTDRQSRYT